MAFVGLLVDPPRPVGHGSAPTDADHAQAYKRCVAYLERMPEAISGSGGHDATFAAACIIWRFGLSEPEAWDAACWFNASKCQPVWLEPELRHKLSDAYEKVAGEGRLGEKLTERTYDHAVEPGSVFVPDDRPDAEGKKNGHKPANSALSFSLSASSLSIDFVLAAHGKAEIGDAEIMAALYPKKIVFDRASKDWYFFNGQHWQPDAKGLVSNLVSYQVAAQYLNAAAQKQFEGADKELVDGLVKHGNSLRFSNRISNVLKLATSNQSLALAGDEWDQCQWLLPVANGVVNLKTGELQDGKPGDYVKTYTPVEWRGLDCPAPRWGQFLDEIFNENKELVSFVNRLYGYGVTGVSTEHVFPVLYGHGRNGKDTLIEMIMRALGPMASIISKDVVLAGFRNTGSATPHLYSLRGLRIAWVSETNEGSRLDAGQVKMLTGGGTIVARPLYGKEIRFRPTHLLSLISNHRPHASADDYALWQRLVLIPFELLFVDDPKEAHERKKDANIKDKLEAEASGILAWLVRGCLEWQRFGLKPPECVKNSTKEYQDDEDLIGQFITDSCVVGPPYSVRSSELYQAYVEWSKGFGIREMNGNTFGARIAKRFELERRKTGRFYVGIGLPKVFGVNI